MSTVRIAVASTPLTTTLGEAIPAAAAAVAEAGRAGAVIVCLPEAGLPGHRVQGQPVPDVSQAELDAALRVMADAARQAAISVIVGSERLTPRGRELVAVVIGSDGTVMGVQPKTQLDPTEEADYAPGYGRHIFEVGGLTFGVAICHEAFRYPETVRAVVVRGAQVVFVPHFVTTVDGTLPQRWRDPANPYNETALRLRALENTVYIAAANVAGPDQGSVTGVIGPDGALLASLEYGVVGVATEDLDLDRADRSLALRWVPERNLPI